MLYQPELLSENEHISEAELAPAPGHRIRYLSERLATRPIENQDLEYIIVIVYLIIGGIFPPPELCHSIFRVLISYSGADLTDHILSTSTEAAICFGENLARHSSKSEKIQQEMACAHEDAGREKGEGINCS